LLTSVTLPEFALTAYPSTDQDFVFPLLPRVATTVPSNAHVEEFSNLIEFVESIVVVPASVVKGTVERLVE
jgi:hypothetical protein